MSSSYLVCTAECERWSGQVSAGCGYLYPESNVSEHGMAQSGECALQMPVSHCGCHGKQNLLVRVRGPDAYQCVKQKWSMSTGLASGQHGKKSI